MSESLNPTPAIDLARVSTKEQREAGNSIPGQVDRIERYYELNPHLHREKSFIYDESAHSATAGEHFNEVIAYIKQQEGRIALVCDKVDRLIRNFVTSIHKISPFIESGQLELHFVSDNLIFHKESSASEKFYFNIAISLAQYYSDAIGDNVKRGYERILRDGRWYGNTPLGYISVYSDEGKRIDIVPDPLTKHLIQQTFELYASGNNSVASLLKTITTAGLTDRNDRPINRQRLDAILKNPFYCGYMVSKGRKHVHKYEALITKELFYTCLDLRKRNKQKKVKYKTRRFLFGSGLLTCEKCGLKITAEQKLKPSGKKYIYYSCTGAKGCKRAYVPETNLIQQVQEATIFLKRSEEWIDTLIEAMKTVTKGKQAFEKQEVRRLWTEHEKLQNRVNQLPELLMDERISVEFHDRKVLEYKKKQRDIEVRLQQFTDVDEEYLQMIRYVFATCNMSGDIFNGGDRSEQREFLDHLFQNSILSGKILKLQLKQPYQAIYELGKQNILNQQPYIDTFRTLNWQELRNELFGFRIDRGGIRLGAHLI